MQNSSTQKPIAPQNFEETIVWYYIIGTYVFYFMGIQYITGPLMAWFLVLYLIFKIFIQSDDTPPEERVSIPWGVWVWVFSMMVMLMALIMGHLDFDLGSWRLIKSVIDQFPRTWGLFAAFPLIGCLNIRPRLLFRAASIVCIQHLIYLTIGYVAYQLGADGHLYDTPFARFAGGTAASQVLLYIIDEAGTGLRLQLNTPFPPALGVLGNVYFWLCLHEENKKLRWIGVIASLLMVWFSVSRAGRVCVVVIPLAIWVINNIRRPAMQLTAAVTCFVGGIASTRIIQMIEDYTINARNERAGSTRIREMLRRMALQRWQEAPIWGHGVADTGIKLVRAKGVGSHGVWHGILFVHGLVGFLALAVPMVCSAIDLLLKIQHSKIARVGLAVVLVLSAYGFTENFEGQAYLFWPGLVALGMGLKEKIPVVSKHYEGDLSVSSASL